MKLIPQLAVTLILITSASAKVLAASMPPVSGKDLNGKPWTAPGGLPGDRTLVLIGFDEPQQQQIDTWTKGLSLDQPANAIPWIEMPLIDNPGMFMRWFINAGMRGGIPSKETRSHVWTAYTDKKSFMTSCGMNSTTDVYALVVDREGNILQKEVGNWTPSGSQRLLKALRAPKS